VNLRDWKLRARALVAPNRVERELDGEHGAKRFGRRVMRLARSCSSSPIPIRRRGALEELRDEQARMQAGQRISYAAFSAPAYSSDGRALVYATYYCGPACGYGWIFLMEKSDERWRVRGVNLLWIS
jgi:hypothetical protein